jgi:fluoride ion exporter CrcB/FEX
MAIAVGGALGSLARHGVNVLVHGRWPMMKFPLATAVVNIVGCLVIGLARRADHVGANYAAALLA